MKKTKILSTSAIAAMLLLSACGKGEQSSETKNKQESSPKTAETSGKQTSEKEETKETKSSGGILNPNIAKETEGKVKVVYTNEKPNYVNDMDGFKVSVDEYQIVKVTDMNSDYHIEFDDQNEGYVITAKVTIDNTTNKAMYYTNNFSIQLENDLNYIPAERTFVRDEYPKSKKETETSKWAAGEKVSGLVSFTLTDEQFDSLKKVKPKFIIGGGAADNSKFSGSNHKKGIFDFVYSDKQEAQAKSESKLFPDKLTTDNLANKKMIFEKQGIDETKQLGDVKVTLEGVQYTEVIPTKANKERFSNFGDNGIVAVTVKLKLDNQTDDPISIWNIGSKLAIDKNRGHIIAQTMAEPTEPKDIKAGKQGEKYHVFMFRKDDFETIKKFDLEFGPIYGDDGNGLFKNKTVTFSLPR
ncbi:MULTISPECIES: DUF5068 domain-containing protein [Bacillus]|uniref:DUF5068 domain-containing protein n=1 Tax=Bacillus glycinifermentans TaxID=1664069 RepID=A0A0T6BI31_9BACI|nr:MULTISPECIES: DUF5068 domain-containing protein [Bacillus]KRT87112.1 hypothetical protein AB447_209090 [Bacillus glycinifermentans]MEC0342000.1 DUF5068 domain-containing protein [Bacillus sonorensis]MEC0457486.1 DUF5068 domain-containing protein [Bacillus sonorensis]MEC0487162.1 DUF5068 domain-containing protein [Bacillus glycinifermentans]MEC0530719.1 DUF5068 domain-containing protein [Bacillus sonorensis]